MYNIPINNQSSVDTALWSTTYRPKLAFIKNAMHQAGFFNWRFTGSVALFLWMNEITCHPQISPVIPNDIDILVDNIQVAYKLYSSLQPKKFSPPGLNTKHVHLTECTRIDNYNVDILLNKHYGSVSSATFISKERWPIVSLLELQAIYQEQSKDCEILSNKKLSDIITRKLAIIDLLLKQDES